MAIADYIMFGFLAVLLGWMVWCFVILELIDRKNHRQNGK